ncbi:MAG: hypothetical protein MI923_12960 [Phycisphaerales bacterium]|nr:hypothetical protein [Phycisphaerales bacterium]
MRMQKESFVSQKTDARRHLQMQARAHKKGPRAENLAQESSVLRVCFSSPPLVPRAHHVGPYKYADTAAAIATATAPPSDRAAPFFFLQLAQPDRGIRTV